MLRSCGDFSDSPEAKILFSFIEFDWDLAWGLSISSVAQVIQTVGQWGDD